MSLELEERERFRFFRLSPREKEVLIEKLRGELGKRREVVLVVVFGSFLKDYPFRDIDVAIYAAPLEDSLDYKLRLEEELEEVISYPIDVVVLNDAPPWFMKKVLEEGRPIVVKQPLLLEKLYLKAIDEEQVFTRTSKKVDQG